MNTETPPQVVDGLLHGTGLTPEEEKLAAQGVDDLDESATPAAPAADPAPADPTPAPADPAPADPTPAPATPEPVVPALAPVQQMPELPAAPTPPKDFDAELKANEDAYNNGDIDAVELNRRTRALTLEEVTYQSQVRDHERLVTEARQRAEMRAQDDWNTTASAFEAQHAEFLSNPLRHKAMQDSLQLVFQKAQESNEAITDQAALERALKIAVDYTGWTQKATDPSPAPNAEQVREKVGDALKDRRPDAPGQTLGDAPTAHIDSPNGNVAFANLDNLPIEDLEATVAHMNPQQLEAYLADAPGAKANGRGNE